MLQKEYTICELNYPVDKYSLDCFVSINNICIDVEYDGWYWHNLNGIDDSIRDEVMFDHGIKVLRIKSSKMLPDPEILKSHITKLIQSDAMYDEIILSDWPNKS